MRRRSFSSIEIILPDAACEIPAEAEIASHHQYSMLKAGMDPNAAVRRLSILSLPLGRRVNWYPGSHWSGRNGRYRKQEIMDTHHAAGRNSGMNRDGGMPTSGNVQTGRPRRGNHFCPGIDSRRTGSRRWSATNWCARTLAAEHAS